MAGKGEAALLALSADELTSVLVGKYPLLVRRLTKSLSAREHAIESASEELKMTFDLFERRAIRRRINDLRATLSPLNTEKTLHPVECYTSHEGRIDRDRHATAFREVGPPWVLVASNIGSEGIDLHTYTARIIHCDLEWNPAKMEQREGRGDRVGRQLKDKLMILYCLVPRTYDERMFHQLVARDRWHGVLLGKPSSKLSDDTVDAPLIDQSTLEKMRLDLAPRI
jgi:superfamily II DNA/RNA helicase